MRRLHFTKLLSFYCHRACCSRSRNRNRYAFPALTSPMLLKSHLRALRKLRQDDCWQKPLSSLTYHTSVSLVVWKTESFRMSEDEASSPSSALKGEHYVPCRQAAAMRLVREEIPKEGKLQARRKTVVGNIDRNLKGNVPKNLAGARAISSCGRDFFDSMREFMPEMCQKRKPTIKKYRSDGN